MSSGQKEGEHGQEEDLAGRQTRNNVGPSNGAGAYFELVRLFAAHRSHLARIPANRINAYANEHTGGWGFVLEQKDEIFFSKINELENNEH